MVKAAQAFVLILLLACSAQAGWMGNGSPTPPPTSPASASQDSTGGEVTTGETATGETPDNTTETLMQTTLELLAVLPSLL
jgi:hypothetical protein